MLSTSKFKVLQKHQVESKLKEMVGDAFEMSKQRAKRREEEGTKWGNY